MQSLHADTTTSPCEPQTGQTSLQNLLNIQSQD